MLEICIFSGIEYPFNIIVERTYPGFVVPVNNPGRIEKHLFRFPVGDSVQFIQ